MPYRNARKLVRHGQFGGRNRKKFTDLADENEVTAGFMWQTVTRTSRKYQLSAQITSFVPLDDPMEIMYVEITNTGNMQVRFTPTAAIPVYGRSADNLRITGM